jgi:hypothetical protein
MKSTGKEMTEKLVGKGLKEPWYISRKYRKQTDSEKFLKRMARQRDKLEKTSSEKIAFQEGVSWYISDRGKNKQKKEKRYSSRELFGGDEGDVKDIFKK